MAVKKQIEVVTNEKEFVKVLETIGISANHLASQIHIAGLWAINHANVHGDISAAVRLVDAMGKKHDKARVIKWMMHFGKIGVRKGMIVFRKRKDISPENIEAWNFRANEMPYWELNKQQEVKVTFDYLTMLKSVIATHDKKVAELEGKGTKVSEVNVGLLDGLKALVAGYTPVVNVK